MNSLLGNSPLLNNFLVSACLGALIGLIRQWNDQQEAGSAEEAARTGFGGVRTYSLWALLGCLAAFVSENYVAAVLPVSMGLVALHIVAGHVKDPSWVFPGATSFAAAMITCLIGALVNWGYVQGAIVASAFTMVMLGIKQPLHTWTGRFTAGDIRATLQFVAITGVILPLVPDRAMGPFLAFNPYSIWMMVVLISGIGFLGYVLMRMLGAKAGIIATGVVAGLASSTATTLAFSKRSRDVPGLASDYAMAVILSCTTMYARLAVMIGIIDRQLLVVLATPIVFMAAPGILYAVWVWFRSRHAPATEVQTPAIGNPLSLKTSIQFALLYGVAAFVIKVVTAYGWTDAVLPLSFLSGLTSVDAMSLLMANNHTAGVTVLQLAAQAVIITCVANNVAKAGIAVVFGSRGYVLRVAIVLGLMGVAGVGALWLVVSI